MTSPTCTCERCGATTGARPLTWSMQVQEERHGERVQWRCERCTRDNVRSIEGRLDGAWW